MSTIWTPGGEVPVGRSPLGSSKPSGQSKPDSPSASHRGGAGGAEGEQGDSLDRGGFLGDDPDNQLSAEEREALAKEMDEVRRQLLATPVSVLVANHAYGLFELAAVHLSAQSPDLAQARLAVDALGALVEGVGDRLGEAESSLRDALAQIRLAFVQIAGAMSKT